jgi:peptidoglycan/LPS O-acetylase OafA/YrhL
MAPTTISRLSSAPPQRLPYSAALDGLRALAVIAVLGYHLEFGWMRGGFLGVDLFFVISGFLITRLLVDEHRRSGRIALGGFWLRRFRRLVPPLVIVVGASVVATRLWGVPGQWETMRGDAIAALGYAANWRFVLNETSYFDTLVGPSPLRHIWSLAVEEQWYLLWPLVMMALTPWAIRNQRAGVVSAAMLCVGALSALWMAVLFDPFDVSRVYYGTDTRAQQLLVGAALAWLTVAAPRRFTAARLVRSRAAVTAVMLGFIAAVITVGDNETWLYHGGLFALSIGAAILVAAASVPGTDGPLAWLASPFFVAVGKRSYGIYLWHWPVFVFVGPPMGIELPSASLAVTQIAVTLALNEVMYRFVETPVRTANFRPRRLLVGWSAGIAVSALAAVTLLASDLPRLPDVDVLRPDLDTLAVDEATPTQRERETTGTVAPGPILDAVSDGEIAMLATGAREVPRLLLVGDSTALVLAADKPDHLPSRWRSVEYARLGCAITDGDTIDVGDERPTYRGPDSVCGDWEDDWSEISALFRPRVSVVMTGAWEVLDHVIDGQRLSFPSPEWSEHVEQAVRRAADATTAGGGRAVLLRLPCMEHATGSSVNAAARNDSERVAGFNEVLERVASSRPMTSTLPLDELLCPDGEFLDSIDGEKLRFDGVHLTPRGAQLVWEWLDDKLTRFESPVN